MVEIIVAEDVWPLTEPKIVLVVGLERAKEFIIFAGVAAVPLTVDVIVLPDETNVLVLIIVPPTVDITPLRVAYIKLPLELMVFVLIIGLVPDGSPLTITSNVLALEVRSTLLIISASDETPLTLDVIIFNADDKLLAFISVAEFESTPFI